MNTKTGYIYAIENNFDDKVYIGRTIKTIKERFKQHKRSALTRPNCLFHKFMALHGPENFSVKELRKVKYTSIIELDLIEEECIRDYGSLNTIYNDKRYEMDNLTLKKIAKERKPRVMKETIKPVKECVVKETINPVKERKPRVVEENLKRIILPSPEEVIKIALENTVDDQLLIQDFLDLFLDEEYMIIKTIEEQAVENKIFISASLLKWFGYETHKDNKTKFIQLLDSNEIPYKEIRHQDPLTEQFPELQEEIKKMAPMHLARKKWLVMEPDNLKEAIMCLTTKRSKEIRKYYLLLEKLVQLYGAYTHKFKENKLKIELESKDREIESKDREIESKDREIEDRNNHVLLLKNLLVDSTKREKLQVLYISTSRNYAKQNRLPNGQV